MKVSKSILIIIFFVTSILQCATAPRKQPAPKAEPNAKQVFEQARVHLDAGAETRAIRLLQKLYQEYPDTDVAFDAHMALADHYYKKQMYKESYRHFLSVVDSEYFSPREATAALGAAKSLYQQGQYDEALALTNRAMQASQLELSTQQNIHELRFSIHSKLGDNLYALQDLLHLHKISNDKNDRQKYRLKMLDFIEGRLNDDELKQVSENRELGAIRGYALFKVGQRLFDEAQFDEAKEALDDVRSLLPDTDLADRASHLIAQIQARREVHYTRIGAVLPLSGRHRAVAEKTLKGLQLGLGIFGQPQSDFQLAIIDSEGNPDAARRAVERLVTEDHVIAIVGSLLSRTAVSVASKANDLGLPNIALSQKAGLTEIGPYVFRNALTSEMQVRFLVQEAMKQGLRKFAILYPNDPYGVEYANIFWDEVLANGGEIRAAQAYGSGETDFSHEVERMVGTFYLEGRQDEYRLRFQEWLKKNKTFNSRITPPDSLLPPIVDFDALFVPDSAKAIGQIAPMLAYHDVGNIKLLGTNLWNTPNLLQRGGQHVNGSLFVDNVVTNDPQFKNSEFYRSFKSVFGYEPGVFEAQGYDSGLLLRQLIADGARSRISLMQKLREIQSFNSSLGSLVMNPKGELVPPLVGLTVIKDEIQPISH